MSFLKYLLREVKVLRAIMLLGILSQSLSAGISPLAFKNVNQCFKPGFEYCSPCLGCSALESGLIENLRFFNITAAFDAQGKRQYIDDTAPTNDPLMEMIKILFPSPAGQLTSETNAKSNFGQYCSEAHVAYLLNFAHKVRIYYSQKKHSDLPKDITTVTLKIGLSTNWLTEKFPKIPFSNTERNKLLTNIIAAIQQEKVVAYSIPSSSSSSSSSSLSSSSLGKRKRNADTSKESPAKKQKLALSSFYPKYFVEQIITAFFCHKFADQGAIKSLLKNLDADIVDEAKIELIDDLLKIENLTNAEENLNNNTQSVDDIWTLMCSKYILARILPYENSHNPISNGSAEMYDRNSNKLVRNARFSDCVEVTIRHLTNFLLYNSGARKFNIPSNANQNLIDFYKLQTPDKANAGDLEIRSAWNKIVAGLQEPVEYNKKILNSECKHSNELRSGFLNIISVLNNIFELNLEPKPSCSNSSEIETASNWVATGLKKLNTLLRPEQDWTLSMQDIKKHATRNDLTGKITIKVNSKDGNNNLFNFSIICWDGHSFIQNLVINEKKNAAVTINSLKEMEESLNIDYNNKTTISSFFLPNTELFQAQLINSNPCYKIFYRIINSSTLILNVLETLCNLLDKKEIDENQAAPILTNLLHNFLWDDEYSVKTIMPLLERLMNALSNSTILQGEILSLDFTDCDKFEMLQHFPNIKKLTIKNKQIESLNLPCLPHLTFLQLTEMRKLNSLTFTPPLNNLEEIIIKRPIMESIHFPELPKIRILELTACTELKQINFTQPLSTLQEILIQYAQIDSLNLTGFNSLQTISCFNCWKMKLLTLDVPMNNLKKINLNRTAVESLTLSQCPNLTTLILWNTTKLNFLTFTTPMNKLESIELDELNKKTIIGSEFLSDSIKNTLPKKIILEPSKPNTDNLVLNSKLSILKTSLTGLKEKLAALQAKLGLLKKNLTLEPLS